MTAVPVASYRPITHRVALRVGTALTAWGACPLPRGPRHVDRVERIERVRDTAARTLPQLPR